MGQVLMVGGSGGVDIDGLTARPQDIAKGKIAIGQGSEEPVTGAMLTLAEQTSATATHQDLLNGKTAWVNGVKVTGSIPVDSGRTITPSTVNQTAIGSGRYTGGNIVVAGSNNLVASNIRQGVNLFGVVGTMPDYIGNQVPF